MPSDEADLIALRTRLNEMPGFDAWYSTVSLPTGATQSGFFAAAVGQSAMLALFIADIIGWVLRGKWWERLPCSVPSWERGEQETTTAR